MVFARAHPWWGALFEFLKMHLYQYTQKIEHCSNKFDFLPLFCLEGLVPNSVLSGSHRGEKVSSVSYFITRNVTIVQSICTSTAFSLWAHPFLHVPRRRSTARAKVAGGGRRQEEL